MTAPYSAYSIPPLVAHALELLALLLILLVAVGAGLRVLRFLRVYPLLQVGERLVFSLGLGLGVLALAIFFLGMAGALYLPVGLIVLAALGAAAISPLRAFWPQVRAGASSLLRDMRYLPNLCLAAFVLLAVGIALVKALAPVATQDDLMYHLALPRRYLEAHSIGFYFDSTYSGFPQLMEMLYTWGLLLGSDRLSVLLGFAAGMVGPAAAALFAYRYLITSEEPVWRSLPLLVPAIFVTTPLVGFILRAANTDLAQASFDFLAVHAFWVFLALRRPSSLDRFLPPRLPLPDPGRSEPQRRAALSTDVRADSQPFLHTGVLALSGIFAGLAFSTKYYGFVIAFALALAVLFFALLAKPAGVALRRGAMVASFFVPLAGISSLWLMRNLLATGNPTWPLYGVFFRGLYISPESPPQSPETLLGVAPDIGWDTPFTALQFLWQAMTRGPLSLDNQVHHVALGFLLLPALLLLIPSWRANLTVRWLSTLALAYFVAWMFFFSRTSVRYLSTFFLLSSLLGAYGIVALAARLRSPLWKALLASVAGVLLLTQVLQSASSLSYYLPATFALDPSAEERFLARHMDDYEVVRYIESATSPTSVVYVWDGQPRGYRIGRPYVYARLVPLYTGFGQEAGVWRERLRQLGVTHVLTHERDRLAPGQPQGEDPFAGAARAFRERYMRAPLLQIGDYALYELK